MAHQGDMLDLQDLVLGELGDAFAQQPPALGTGAGNGGRQRLRQNENDKKYANN